jgi:hypothetical protein
MIAIQMVLKTLAKSKYGVHESYLLIYMKNVG